MFAFVLVLAVSFGASFYAANYFTNLHPEWKPLRELAAGLVTFFVAVVYGLLVLLF